MQDARKAPILVTGNNVEVTEPIREYVEKKVINVLDKVRTAPLHLIRHGTRVKNSVWLQRVQAC